MTTLRPAQFTDHEAIAALHTQSWKQHYRGIYSNDFLDHKVEADRLAVWHERLLAPGSNQRVILAVDNAAVVGFACLYLNDDPVFGTLLDNLHVLNSYHKSGIGRLLLRDCARIITTECEQPNMYLWVYEQNGNAVKVYEHLGGSRFETVEKQNADGGRAMTHRYVWSDISDLAS